MSTHIYLTRHGETIWNTKKLMQGWKNSPLTPQGIKDANHLSKRLSEIPLAAIYSSTSGRAMNTAEIIKGKSPIKLIANASLREMSFGSWEGKSLERNEQEDTKQWQSFWETPHLFSHDTIEPFVKVQERMVKTINNIAKQHPFESVCVVSHSISLKLLLDYFENKTLEDLWTTPAVPAASLTLIKIDDVSNEIIFKHDISHMNGA